MIFHHVRHSLMSLSCLPYHLIFVHPTHTMSCCVISYITGTETGFYFAWLSLYTQWLWIPAIFGIWVWLASSDTAYHQMSLYMLVFSAGLSICKWKPCCMGWDDKPWPTGQSMRRTPTSMGMTCHTKMRTTCTCHEYSCHGMSCHREFSFFRNVETTTILLSLYMVCFTS